MKTPDPVGGGEKGKGTGKVRERQLRRDRWPRKVAVRAVGGRRRVAGTVSGHRGSEGSVDTGEGEL